MGLHWEDIDFKKKIAHIRHNLVLVENKPVIQDTQTKGSTRSITLPTIAIEALKKHKRVQAREKLMAGVNYNDHGLVVATSVGTPLLPRNLIRTFKRILKKADLPNIRFHDLRHTHATLMLKEGEHLKVVSERLGHSDTRITLETYSHVLPNMQQEAVNRFEKTFLE